MLEKPLTARFGCGGSQFELRNVLIAMRMQRPTPLVEELIIYLFRELTVAGELVRFIDY
jgi:hypothetical protein